MRGTVERANHMLSIAAKALQDVTLKDTDKPGIRRFIRRDPLGVVFVVAPWKYDLAFRNIDREACLTCYFQLSISYDD